MPVLTLGPVLGPMLMPVLGLRLGVNVCEVSLVVGLWEGTKGRLDGLEGKLEGVAVGRLGLKGVEELLFGSEEDDLGIVSEFEGKFSGVVVKDGIGVGIVDLDVEEPW